MKSILMVASLVFLVALCAVVGYVSADAGGEVRMQAVETALAAQGAAFDLYPADCVTFWPQGKPWVDPGWVMVDVHDGDISDRLIPSGDVDINTLWAVSTITYTGADLAGNAIVPLMRAVVTVEPEEVPDTDPPVASLLGCVN